MMKAPLSRAAAEKRARAAQITFAGLVVCALAVATMALPKLTEVPSLEEIRPKPIEPAPKSGSTETTAERVPVNSQGISDRLMQLANRPRQPEVVTEPVVPEDEHHEAEAPAAEGARFVGVIREPDRMLAIVHVAGRQRVMAEGDEIEGVKVLSISPEGVSITEHGVEKKIEKGEHHGASVTMLTGGSTDGAPRGPMGQPQVPGRIPAPGENGTLEGRVEPPAPVHQQQPRRRPVLPGVPASGRSQKSPSGN